MLHVISKRPLVACQCLEQGSGIEAMLASQGNKINEQAKSTVVHVYCILACFIVNHVDG